MNSTGRILAAAAVCLGMAGAAGAATMSFEDARNFSGSGNWGGRDYWEVSDGNDASFGFPLFHSVTFDPVAEGILTAELVLSHAKNSADNGEVWLLWSDGGASLGALSASNDTWVDQVFPLSDSLFSLVAGANWSLALRLTEGTNGTDRVWLDRSVLRGTYRYADVVADLTPGGDGGEGTDSGPGQLGVEEGASGGNGYAPVPEPRSMVLLGSGLLGLAGVLRRRGRAPQRAAVPPHRA